MLVILDHVSSFGVKNKKNGNHHPASKYWLGVTKLTPTDISSKQKKSAKRQIDQMVLAFVQVHWSPAVGPRVLVFVGGSLIFNQNPSGKPFWKIAFRYPSAILHKKKVPQRFPPQRSIKSWHEFKDSERIQVFRGHHGFLGANLPTLNCWDPEEAILNLSKRESTSGAPDFGRFDP